MFARLSRGWSMAKASFAVLRQYPKLAILPVMSGAIFLVIVGAILASLMPQLGRALDRLDLAAAGQRDNRQASCSTSPPSASSSS